VGTSFKIPTWPVMKWYTRKEIVFWPSFFSAFMWRDLFCCRCSDSATNFWLVEILQHTIRSFYQKLLSLKYLSTFNPSWNRTKFLSFLMQIFWLLFVTTDFVRNVKAFFHKLGATLATKQIVRRKRAWKPEPESSVFSCVPFCVRSHGHFEGCVSG